MIIKFVTNSQEEARKWYSKLKRGSEVVSLHISREYAIGKLLSRGTYTKINVATYNETGAQYTIKSVGKAQLLERPKRLV